MLLKIASSHSLYRNTSTTGSTVFAALPAAKTSVDVIGLYSRHNLYVSSEEMLRDVRNFTASLDLYIDIPVDLDDLHSELP